MTTFVGNQSSGIATHADSLVNELHSESGKKHISTKKQPVSAPHTYLIYDNPDKTGHFTPSEKNPCQPGHPARIIIVGKPGCGKRSVMINILENYDFYFDTVTEVHASARSAEHDIFTGDDDDFDYELYQWDHSTDEFDPNPWPKIGVPPIKRFEEKNEDGSHKNHVLILDEPPTDWTTRLRREVGTLMNYNSTHNHCTVFLITQHFQNLPLQVREAATHFIFFPSPNRQITNFWSSRCGVDLTRLFPIICRSKYDSICVDMTGEGPRIRRNVYEPIENMRVKNELQFRKYGRGYEASEEDDKIKER